MGLDPAANLRRTVELIGKLEGVEIVAQSKIYLTEPWGRKNQSWFRNQVIRIRLSEERWPNKRLLARLFMIESRLGRERTSELWEPRPIDIDVLLWGDQVILSPALIVPHQHMRDRAFVLVPLREIDPDFRFPDSGKSIDEALALLKYRVEGETIFQS